jgi:hypothetical protein
MEHLLDIEDIKQKLYHPIAICDGGTPTHIEEHLLQLFALSDIPYTPEFNLYSRNDFDLSKYGTIAFGTNDTVPYLNEEMQRLFSFDKQNLKTLIVLNQNAFRKVEQLVKTLDIECIGFVARKFGFINPFEQSISSW